MPNTRTGQPPFRPALSRYRSFPVHNGARRRADRGRSRRPVRASCWPGCQCRIRRTAENLRLVLVERRFPTFQRSRGHPPAGGGWPRKHGGPLRGPNGRCPNLEAIAGKRDLYCASAAGVIGHRRLDRQVYPLTGWKFGAFVPACRSYSTPWRFGKTQPLSASPGTRFCRFGRSDKVGPGRSVRFVAADMFGDTERGDGGFEGAGALASTTTEAWP